MKLGRWKSGQIGVAAWQQWQNVTNFSSTKERVSELLGHPVKPMATKCILGPDRNLRKAAPSAGVCPTSPSHFVAAAHARDARQVRAVPLPELPRLPLLLAQHHLQPRQEGAQGRRPRQRHQPRRLQSQMRWSLPLAYFCAKIDGVCFAEVPNVEKYKCLEHCRCYINFRMRAWTLSYLNFLYLSQDRRRRPIF